MLRDEVIPGDRWVFDESVTAAFDDMLSRSIPQYDVMRSAVAMLAARHAVSDSVVVDLGCSRGEALASVMAGIPDASVSFVGAEVSPPMIAAARERFALDPRVSILPCDLRREYPVQRGAASVTLAILTLQFTPIEYRQQIVQRMFDTTRPGGVVLLVEKVLGASAGLDGVMVDAHHQMKAENGYTRDAIDRKRMSLEGVLVPVTAAWNEELLRMAGFASVDCFWRWMNFAGWIAVKRGEP